MLRGSASILGYSIRRDSFLKEDMLRSSRGLGAFVGHQIASDSGVTGFFLLVLSKECLGELQGGSFSKFTFMKYE